MAKVEIAGIAAPLAPRGQRLSLVGPAGPSSKRFCRVDRGRANRTLEVRSLLGSNSYSRGDATQAVEDVLGERDAGVVRTLLREVPVQEDLAESHPEQWSSPPTGRAEPAGYRCQYCGAPASCVDHVWPKVRGGDGHPNNLVKSCGPCNLRKGSRSLLGRPCPACGQERHPSDVVTATGDAFYACRCGVNWTFQWDLQHPPRP